MLFIHLIGTISENEKNDIWQVNTYQNAFDFYQASKELHKKILGNSEIELFCVLGAVEKTKFITNIIEEQIKNNFNRIIQRRTISVNNNKLDTLSYTFNRIVQEYIFADDEIRFPRKYRILRDELCIDCFWGGTSSNDDSYLLIDKLIESWLFIERPCIMGKQIMIRSFQLADLKGRKIIGTFPDNLSNDWFITLEGGFKIKLNSEMSFTKEKVGIRDFGVFSIGDIDSILNNPIYAYGKLFDPIEIYEEWLKVFLYAVALQNQIWTTESLALVFEEFLKFIEKNICDVSMYTSPIIKKEEYYKILHLNVMKLKNYLKGKDEQVISKELWLLLNSRYVYLPYIYNLSQLHIIDNNPSFNYKYFKEKLCSLSVKDSYQKGINFEEVASYFINNIPGLKISGMRVKTENQEIDLSAINISLNSNLWEMGAYILIECKNWEKKVDVKVIRGLSHISELKGNKTTILFSSNGLTKDAEKEIIRTALNGRFIISITKEELYCVKQKNDCYNLLISKWKSLQVKVQMEVQI